ncbi:MAG TPA: DUF6286 domain-containing protein [Pseudonocardiaceae bacterium]
MIRRPRRGIPATLTALVALVVCALVATVAIQLIGGQPPVFSYQTIAANLHRAQWRDLVVAIVGGAVALVGLILLLTAVVPGRAMVLPLGSDDSDLVAGVSRRSLLLTLRSAAGAVDGVAKVRLALRGRTVAVVAHADRVDDTGIADALRDAVQGRVEQLSPAITPTIKVRVHPARKVTP